MMHFFRYDDSRVGDYRALAGQKKQSEDVILVINDLIDR